jgi:hypothetical protein
VVFQKLLSLLHKNEKEQKPPENVTSSVRVNPVKIVVLPHVTSQAGNQPTQFSNVVIPIDSPKTQPEEVVNEELCEEPTPYQQFSAVSFEIARERAAAKNLAILFSGREKWDLFGRNHAFWSIPPASVVRLLRLETDMKVEDEFTDEEKPILHDMLLRKWIKKMRSNGKNYYYGLNQKTAKILQNQLKNRRTF